MAKKEIIELTHMKNGESGVVMELAGGEHFAKKLQSMGVRPGKRITKVSSHFWRGPQTIQIGGAQIAVGYGMARKVYVEVDR